MVHARDIEKSNVALHQSLVNENHRRASYAPTFKLPDGYGNVVTVRLCRSGGHPQFCWEPRVWARDADFVEFWTKQTEVRPDVVFVDRPIVHFRCGNGPFNSQLQTYPGSVYMLPCPADVRRLMRHSGIQRAWMIVGGHGGHRRECDDLARQYTRELPGVTLLDRASPEIDFMWLKSAPKVVAVIMSSFTFTSRLGKLDTLFMPNMLNDTFTAPWIPFHFDPCPAFHQAWYA